MKQEIQPEIQPGCMVKARLDDSQRYWIPCLVVGRHRNKVEIKPKGHKSAVWHDLERRPLKFWASRNPTAHVPDDLPAVVDPAPSTITVKPSPVAESAPERTTLLSVPQPTPQEAPMPPAPARSDEPKPFRSIAAAKIAIARVLDRIMADRESLRLDALKARLRECHEHARVVVDSTGAFRNILNDAGFDKSLILPEPNNLVTGSEVSKALRSLEDRLSRIERELGLAP